MTDVPSASEVPPILRTNRPSDQPLRYGQAIAFVAVWMIIGWVFHLDANSYLLIGVPLVVAFQIFVRRKPLVTLWVRDAATFRFSILGIILGLAFATMPVINLVQSVGSWRSQVPETLWNFSCIVGAFAAGFSLCHFKKETSKSLLICLGTAGVIGCGIMAGTALLQKHSLALTAAQLWTGASSFLLYFPVCFVLEEVAFRGMIDSHVHQAGDKWPWLSAIVVSALWGLWHLPIFGETKILNLIVLVIFLPLMHVFDGMFLSFGWRRSGNLAVPACVHALIDAVRNALLR
jgi:membrane protease YdiL (CAAX protease family)